MTTTKASTQHLANAIQNTQQQQQQQVSPYRKAQAYLKKMEPAIMEALPKNTGMSPERLSRITLTTMKSNPKLLNCSIESILGAVLQSAQLGLEPDLLGSCYFIPYKNVCSFQIGYRGLIDLVTRKGEVTTISANPVYEHDIFIEEYGKNETFKHVPYRKGDRGKIVGFYAYAHLKNGGFKGEFMTIEEIEKIRNEHSMAFKYDNKASIWVKHFEQMAQKTVIKRLIKYLPISVETQNAIAHDETVRKDITAEAHHIDIDDAAEDVETMDGQIIENQN